jgi:Arc/MetJ-type ribon-helix-helix transcriptional regulator
MASQMTSSTAEFEALVLDRLNSGRYANRDEVFAAAKTALLQYEADDDLDVEYVRQAVAEGMNSGTYESDAFADLRKKYGLLPRV